MAGSRRSASFGEVLVHPLLFLVFQYLSAYYTALPTQSILDHLKVDCYVSVCESREEAWSQVNIPLCPFEDE